MEIKRQLSMLDVSDEYFCPYLTCFNSQQGCHILTGISITYENSARIDTAFVTNLEDALARTAPELSRRICEADKKLRQEKTKTAPKYEYPDSVLTAAAMGYIAKYGIDFRVERNEAIFVRELDAQKKQKKQIYGAGYIISRQAAARQAAARQAAAEKTKAIKWELSERELSLQAELEEKGGRTR